MPLSIVWRDKSDSGVYEEARVMRLFNLRIPDRRPLAVAFVESESDIVNAVKLAIEKKCRVSLRSGGHSWPAWSVREDAILVDLGGYSEIALDETTGIVRASPSTTGKDLYNYLLARGRLFLAGHCPDIGLGGALLCGGMGWNCNVGIYYYPYGKIRLQLTEMGKNWGWACEHLVAVDVVTANGTLIRADDHQNSDLFWAARGAGPGFPRDCYALPSPNPAASDIHAFLGICLSY